MGSFVSSSGASSPAFTARGTSIPSMANTSQSPGCDCSISDRAVPVPSYSLTLTLTSLASSKGRRNAGSAWSHHMSAFSCRVCAWEVAATTPDRAIALPAARARKVRRMVMKGSQF